MRRLFVEDCTRYREYIHLLSFNYDFHLFKAQMYLNGSQRIFSKGYGVTHMLTGLLQEYPECPMFSRNRLCIGNVIGNCSLVILEVELVGQSLGNLAPPSGHQRESKTRP